MWAFIRHDQTCKRPFFATPDLHFLYGVPLKSLLCILLCHGPKKRPMPLMILFIGWVCFTCTHQLYASRMDLPQHKVSQLCSAPLHCFSAVLTACKFSGGPVSNQICRMHLCSALTYPLMFGCTLVSGASERWTLPDLPVKPQPLCHITAACTQVVAEHLLLHPPSCPLSCPLLAEDLHHCHCRRRRHRDAGTCHRRRHHATRPRPCTNKLPWGRSGP
mmetsp:Transcript_72021/g.120790  ORF Transcript_72021/g.120790 Transcript_72021/m.120790 type:complete len:218 (-) Transcript_72021:977-1630(-)